MITAEEYCRKHQNSNHPDMINKLMREFAKLHVEAALKEAYKTTNKEQWIDDFINLKNSPRKKAIMKSYSLDKIK